MPLALQAKLLRVLQDGEFERVGGDEDDRASTCASSPRPTATSSEWSRGPLPRGSLLPAQRRRAALPPLRERLEDIPLLIAHFLERAAQRLRRAPATVSPQAMRCCGPPWPGNIRELQNVLEAAMVLSDGIILPEHLSPAIQRGGSVSSAAGGPFALPPGASLDDILAEGERRLILDALQKVSGVQARAAKLLGISERSLWYRVKKLRIPTRSGDEEPLP